METLGLRTFRKIGNPKKKRQMNITEGDARSYGWELDEAPKPINNTQVKETTSKPKETPPMPDIAKNAMPEVGIPEVPVKKAPARRGRKPKATKPTQSK